MTDNALSNESTGANRPNVSVLCYAVFPWTSNWEMLPKCAGRIEWFVLYHVQDQCVSVLDR